MPHQPFTVPVKRVIFALAIAAVAVGVSIVHAAVPPGWTQVNAWSTAGGYSSSAPNPLPFNTLRFKMWGAGGGGANLAGAVGGGGAFVDYLLTIAPSTAFMAYVGGKGIRGTAGGLSTSSTGKGGNAGSPNDAASGGSSSEIKVGGTRSIVAGGGGGGAINSGGNLPFGGAGGCNTGTSGGGNPYSGDPSGGAGGTQSAGGNGPFASNGDSVSSGGNGGYGGNGGSHGGGGGGGGYAGGGGGSWSSNDFTGGGGGGSSYPPAPTSPGVCAPGIGRTTGGTTDPTYIANAGMGGQVNSAGNDGAIVVLMDTNECATSNGGCLNGATCTNQLGSFLCTCVPGYQGTFCQTNTNECASLPCRNAGTCVDDVLKFSCVCVLGYSGLFCQTNVNECASQPCVNGGTCVDVVGGFGCNCVPGYSGAQCQTEVDECGSFPCANGGTCTDFLNRFTCACVSGYSGLMCQTNVNECASLPCRNGGTCNDLVQGFTCTCAGGYSGLYCQTNVNECGSQPCTNGGTCTDLTNAFTCACPPGYSGAQCQTEINECGSQPCQNGGTCTDLLSKFTCACPLGVTGIFCQTNINECASQPCLNAGTCLDAQYGYTCKCAAGYSGLFCQTDVNECASQPCTNGGTCTDLIGAFTCRCPPGYSGARCQTDINECGSTPCANGGTCTDLVAKFTCTCGAGYSGIYCQTDVNECASQPCVNGGTCKDGVGKFSCQCVPGYSGVLCETDVNECASVPCRFGGTCVDKLNGFTCQCVAGYSGLLCQTDVNECASVPCRNGGTCTDFVNVFTCTCRPGYSGLLCQTDVNECASQPCTNGGTCTDHPNAFTCTCPAGFQGVRCQTDINECASNPCQNSGTCVDHVNRFQCLCTSYFTGAVCTVDVNECLRSPDYGGCPPGQATWCYNTYGSWSCLYFDGGLTVPAGTTTDLVPLIRLTTGTATPTYINTTFVTSPQIWRLAPVGVAGVPPLPPNSLDGLTLYIGNADGDKVKCSKVLEPAATAGLTRHTVSCITPPWYGINHLLLVNASVSPPLVLASSNHTFKYPDPSITPLSLRLNITDVPTGTVTLPDGDSTRIIFFGKDFAPPSLNNPMIIRYGSNANPLQFACALDRAATTETVAYCDTEVGSSGIGLRFTVIVGALSSQRSADILNQPAVPIVSRMSGCTDVQNTTTLCDTEGGTVVTIYGQNFVNLQLTVFLGGDFCLNPVADLNNTGLFLTCTLPVGAGLDIDVRVSCAGRTAKRPLVGGLSYAPPRVTQIIGCQSPVFDQFTGVVDNYTVADCSRHGGNLITINGFNFGVSGALVLVGTTAATTIVHTIPHRQLTFIAPAGTSRRSVIVIQAGTIQASSAQVSYHKCFPGEYQSDLECLPCSSDAYSSEADSFGCDGCDAGLIPKLPNTVTPSAGASSCVECTAGRYSLPRHSNCTSCAAGTAQPSFRASSCDTCAAGRYSNSSESTRCSDCPEQTKSSVPGSTTCVSCAGILNQPGRGQTACLLCLTGTFYSRQRGGCEACRPGVVCNSSGIFGDGSHYVFYDAADDTIESLPCLNGFCASCPKFPEEERAVMYDPVTNTTIYNPSFFPLTDGQAFSCCSANRVEPQENNLCGACLPGYYVWGEACVLCDKPNAKLIFGFVFTTWIYVCVFYRLAQISRADTRIFINFFQFVLIFLQTRAGGIVAWLSVFNMNVFQSSGSTCVAPLAPLVSLATGLFIPVVGFGFLFFNAFLHYLMYRCLRAGRCDDRCWHHVPHLKEWDGTEPIPALPIAQRVTIGTVWVSFWFDLRVKMEFWPVWNTYRRTFLAFLNSSYPSIAQTVFTFFNCVDSNGDSILLPFPSISCRHDPDYLAAQPIFYIMLIVVCAYPLILFARLFQLQHRNLLFNNPEIKFVYGSMHEAYPQNLYYWEVWVLIRRLTIAAVAQTVEPLDLPKKFTWITFLSVMFLFVHFLKRPYVLFMDNYFESLSLVVLALIALFLIAAENPLSSRTALGLSGMAFVVGALLFSRIILSRYEAYILRNRVPLNSRYSMGQSKPRDSVKPSQPRDSVKLSAQPRDSVKLSAQPRDSLKPNQPLQSSSRVAEAAAAAAPGTDSGEAVMALPVPVARAPAPAAELSADVPTDVPKPSAVPRDSTVPPPPPDMGGDAVTGSD